MYLQDEGVKHRDCLMASVSSGTEMATCFMAIISAVVCRRRRGENSRKERAGVGETDGDPGFQRHHSKG